MKLIQEFYSEVDAEKARDKLRKRGILTYISSKGSNNLSSIYTGAFKVGLWAVLDNQYHDACKILTKKQCKVRYPLSEDQMVEIEINNKKEAPSIILRALLKFLVFVIVVVGTTIFLIYRGGNT